MKGVVIQSRLTFIKARGGQEAVSRVLSRVEPVHRTLLSELILPMGWYPFELNCALDRAIVETLGGGQALYRQMGEQSAVDSLSATHKNLIRARDPHGLLKHSAQIHNLYYDTGYRTYEWTTPSSAILRTFECRSFSTEDCQTNMGWHEHAIRLCGGRGARVTDPRCRARGDKCCEYKCEWQSTTRR